MTTPVRPVQLGEDRHRRSTIRRSTSLRSHPDTQRRLPRCRQRRVRLQAHLHLQSLRSALLDQRSSLLHSMTTPLPQSGFPSDCEVRIADHGEGRQAFVNSPSNRMSSGHARTSTRFQKSAGSRQRESSQSSCGDLRRNIASPTQPFPVEQIETHPKNSRRELHRHPLFTVGPSSDWSSDWIFAWS